MVKRNANHTTYALAVAVLAGLQVIADGKWAELGMIGPPANDTAIALTYRLADDSIYLIDAITQGWSRVLRLLRISRTGAMTQMAQSYWNEPSTPQMYLGTTFDNMRVRKEAPSTLRNLTRARVRVDLMGWDVTSSCLCDLAFEDSGDWLVRWSSSRQRAAAR